jgi:hypothetical protein
MLGHQPAPCPTLIKNILNEIPLPYSLTALRWYEGVDIKNEPVTLWIISRSITGTEKNCLGTASTSAKSAM